MFYWKRILWVFFKMLSCVLHSLVNATTSEKPISHRQDGNLVGARLCELTKIRQVYIIHIIDNILLILQVTNDRLLKYCIIGFKMFLDLIVSYSAFFLQNDQWDIFFWNIPLFASTFCVKFKRVSDHRYIYYGICYQFKKKTLADLYMCQITLMTASYKFIVYICKSNYMGIKGLGRHVNSKYLTIIVWLGFSFILSSCI